MEIPVRYSLLRDGVSWGTAKCTALDVRESGELTLAPLPVPIDTSVLRRPAPFNAVASGIAVDRCGRVLLSNSATSTLLFLIPSCGFRYAREMDGNVGSGATPVGLAVDGDTVYVANPLRSRVDLFTLPGLELRATRTNGLLQPGAIAVDTQHRLYVVDRGLNRVVRFLRNGNSDTAFNSALEQQTAMSQPWGIAVSELVGVIVTDAVANTVFVFGFDGTFSGSLALPATRPRAIACSAERIFVSDEANGAILAIDSTASDPLNAYFGQIPDFRAAVSAMACDMNGRLFVKSGADDAYAVLEVAGYGPAGTLLSGQLDAGMQSDWERIVVRAEIPNSTGVLLETFVTDNATRTPAAADWQKRTSLDCFVNSDPGPAPQIRGTFRYLWLRVTLTSTDGRTSPVLRQVEAQTSGRSYLQDLPAIYRRDDRQTRFLERWLGLYRSDMEDFERQITNMPAHFDSQKASAEELPWVAQLLGFDPPSGMDETALRRLLGRVPQLYAERGTLAGIRDWVEIYSGIRPRIIEAWPARKVWILGETSSLGFDTMLPGGSPDGFIVPGVAVTDPAYAGLRRDEYGGSAFDWYLSSTTDKVLDLSLQLTPTDALGQSISVETLRWTGQVRPRFAERYTISLRVAGAKSTDDVRVRFWIDARLWIDQWQDGSAQSVLENVAVLMEEPRWYPLRLDVRTTASNLNVQLMWSSRSQIQQVIPQDCLYSVADDHADLSVTEDTAFKVGDAIVGESGPLDPDSFGDPLFGEYAHLFTVLAPAGCACDGEQRSRLRAAIDAEKPAHTDYHLCFVKPQMRVGFQARVGIDAIVADGPAPLHLDEDALGRSSYLAEAPGRGARTGARVGQNLIVG
jgi:phage tail-like protein